MRQRLILQRNDSVGDNISIKYNFKALVRIFSSNVLVRRELEFSPIGVSEWVRASCHTNRGILPRRFIALAPIPKGERKEAACSGAGCRVLRSWPLGRRSGRTSALPYPPPRPISFVAHRWASSNLPLEMIGRQAPAAGFLQLAISLGKDHLRQTVEFIGRREVADRRVQPHVVIVVHVTRDLPPGLVKRLRTGRPDALSFQAAMPAFELPVALRIVGTRPHVGHAHQADERLEIPAR